MPDEKCTQAETPGSPEKNETGSSQKSDKKASAGGAPKSPPPLNLEKLKNTTTSQSPVSTIAGTVRTRVVSSSGPKMDWQFSIVAGIACMFLALVTHIFGINGGLVLNDRLNLSFLLSQSLMGKTSEKILTDMLGVAPLSQPWLKASLIGDLGEYKLQFVWYHAVHVLWHALAAGLVFFFILTMVRHLHHQKRCPFNPYYLAGATAVLFACHPLSCEAVTYLSCRSALLGTVNFFQALVFLLLSTLVKHPVARACFTIMACYSGAMALWSNPETIALPAVALFCLFLFKRPLSQWRQTIQEHPFLIGMGSAFTIGIPCLVLLPVQYTTAINLFLPTLSPVSYAASQIKAFVFYYLRCFFFPVGLSIDPPLAQAGSFSDPFVLAALAILAGLVYLIVRTKQPVLALASALVLAGFVPHAFMVQPDTVADWVGYLPVSGMMLFAACAYCYLAERHLQNATILLACITVLFCGISMYRDFQFGSTFTLVESGLSLRPKSGFLHATLALEYLKRDQIDEAEKEANLAIGYTPNLVLAQMAQAKVKMARGRFADAGKMLSSCLTLADTQKLAAPIKAECHLAQLQCLIGEVKEKEANELLTRLAAELPPDDARLIYQVGLAEYQMHSYEKAFKVLEKALETNPTLVECWLPMTQCALSVHAFDTAYQTARSYADQIGGPDANMLFARTCILSNHEKEGEDILKQMLSAQPKNARALYLLSRLYRHSGKSDDWKKYRDEAIKVDPDIAVKFDLPELDAAESTESPATGAPGAPVNAPSSPKTAPAPAK